MKNLLQKNPIISMIVGVAIIILSIALFWKPVPVGMRGAYIIEYQTPLTAGQKTLLATRMINYFTPNCRPSSITVGNSVTISCENFCLSGQEMKSVSDKCLGTTPDEVKSITYNGTQIWPQ